MKHFKFLFILTITMFLVNCKTSNDDGVKTETKTDVNGYSYETVTNDPTGLRLYTLNNGLTVYLSKNTDEPKIQTYIAVRAGSNYDQKNRLV